MEAVIPQSPERTEQLVDLEKQFATDRAEARSVAFTDVDASKDGRHFRGYAAVYDQPTDLGDFTESNARGAFRKVLSAGHNVPMLYDHNPTLPVLATTGGGTLRLKEDGKGLIVEADVANHFMGQAVYEMVQRGDIRGMSYGFVAGAGNSRIENRGGKPHREITGFKRLLDVSPTWDPAYAGTDAGFRSLRKALEESESLEDGQPILGGAYEQPQDGVDIPEVNTGDDPDEPADADESPAAPVEEPSGASEQEEKRTALAARKRRLSMMGITLLSEGKWNG